jgi:hypothetical protein
MPDEIELSLEAKRELVGKTEPFFIVNVVKQGPAKGQLVGIFGTDRYKEKDVYKGYRGPLDEDDRLRVWSPVERIILDPWSSTRFIPQLKDESILKTLIEQCAQVVTEAVKLGYDSSEIQDAWRASFDAPDRDLKKMDESSKELRKKFDALLLPYRELNKPLT